jgi:hypothetical protein
MSASPVWAGGTSAAADLLAAMPDPGAELELRRQLTREAYASAWADGWRQGYESGARLLERQWPSVAAPVVSDRPDYAELVRRRLTVHGEQRDRETYGQPHPDDFPGRKEIPA